MRSLIVSIFIILICASCKHTQYIDRIEESTIEKEVPITNTKIEYRDRLVYDSIYMRDSIYMYVKGDTVLKYIEKINTRFINKTDTLIKTDTIKVPVTITNTITKVETQIKEVNKIYWWQKLLMYSGLISIIAGIIYLVLKIKKI